MEIISEQGFENLAKVYVAKFRHDKNFMAEFVDAKDPKASPDKKWIIIISTQFGCPVACPMCDAGGEYFGDLTVDEMFSQIDHVVSLHKAKRLKLAKKFKVQFARMGEPALNPSVLDVISVLPDRYNTQGLIPCVATTAPRVSKKWFSSLCDIRHSVYKGKPFQLQLSINSTDEQARDRLMPMPKMSLRELGIYASEFFEEGCRKTGLNFALMEDAPIDVNVVAKYFNPKHCVIKITPLNPTYRSTKMGLKTALLPDAPEKIKNLCSEFERLGFEVIVSIGDERENTIGSNCGMAVYKTKKTFHLVSPQ